MVALLTEITVEKNFRGYKHTLFGSVFRVYCAFTIAGFGAAQCRGMSQVGYNVVTLGCNVVVKNVGYLEAEFLGQISSPFLNKLFDLGQIVHASWSLGLPVHKMGIMATTS